MDATASRDSREKRVVRSGERHQQFQTKGGPWLCPTVTGVCYQLGGSAWRIAMV